MKIAVAGVGYVGLSLAALLAAHHDVRAVSMTARKVESINSGVSPIQDSDISRFFPPVSCIWRQHWTRIMPTRMRSL